MSLKIRLKRMGKRNLPFYRLVVVDSRWRRDGKTIADIGWYDPVKQPGQCSIKVKEVYKWLENGAQISETARSLLKQQGIWDKFRSGEYKNETEQDVMVETIQEKPKEEPKETSQAEPVAAAAATGTPSEPQPAESAAAESTTETPTEESESKPDEPQA